MSDQFGSPGSKDPTAEWEKMIEEEVAVAQAFLNKDAPAEMNRPPGTTPMPKEAKFQDWQQAINDPAELDKRFKARATVVGPEIAAHEMLVWDDSMRKAGGNG